MAKFVKVGNHWLEEEMQELVDHMDEAGIEGVVVKGEEIEVFDGELEKITIEGREVLEEERFSGDSLFGLKE